MKKLFVGVLLCSVVNFGRASAWINVEKNKTIKIATEGAFAPFNYFKGKELSGFEVDLGKEIAKHLALKSEWKTTPFDSLLIGLNQDRYDLVIASHGITEERAKAVDFTDPHYCTGGIIVSNTGGVTSVADLKGKVVGVQVGSSYLDNIKKVAGVKEIKTYPKDTDVLQNLMAKRVDAWITDKFVAFDAIKANPAAKLQTGAMLFQEKVAMAVAKGNTTLKDEINSALSAVKKDGTYAKLSRQYFNEDISCK